MKAIVVRKTLASIREMKVPLYVILVGGAPTDGEACRGTRSALPALILDMVQAANGAQGGARSPRAWPRSSPTTACS